MTENLEGFAEMRAKGVVDDEIARGIDHDHQVRKIDQIGIDDHEEQLQEVDCQWLKILYEFIVRRTYQNITANEEADNKD